MNATSAQLKLPASVGDPIDAASVVPAPLDDLARLAARRDRIAAVLTAIMMLAYFGFIAMVAFAKPTVGTVIAGGRLSVGIALGAAVIMLAPILTAIYVWWANRHYDRALHVLRRGRR